MKIELKNSNKVFLSLDSQNYEIHPLWLRERANTKQLVDQLTEQRIYDPSTLSHSIVIKSAFMEREFLNIEFSDGISSQFKISELCEELDTQNMKKRAVPNKTYWYGNLKNKPIVDFNNDFESKETFEMLKKFHKYGFVVIKNVPTKDNYIVNFANSIGAIRPTNFGTYFDVKSVPDYNDLAYTPISLLPHTDNPYRKPVPCIQLLHCIKNEVKGGFSTLVDGYAVANQIKEKFKEYFDILTSTKVRFRFIDKNVVLENWGELIELDEDRNIKQIRYNTKIEYVPHLEKKKLELFYQARKKMGELCCSMDYEIQFKLQPGDLLMMDNYRTLHGRTSYDPRDGMRHLQGCYIDYDSSEGRLLHLNRKYKVS